MITFNKLVIISGNHYNIQTGTINDISTLFSNITDVNTTIVLVMNYGGNTYAVDLGSLVVSNANLLESTSIHALIAQLTPEMIYSYSTDLFVQDRVVRSFMSSDLPDTLMVTPYNINTGETSNTTYDPSFPDMMITCDKYPLTEVFPIIDNKLRYCTWNAGNILMANRVALVRDTPEVTFLSFGDTTTSILPLSSVAANNWNVTTNTVVMLVLAGSLFYDVPYIYQTYTGKNTILELNNAFIMDEFSKRGYSTIDDVINDPDSFVIMVNTNQVLIRDLDMVHVSKSSDVNQFCYYEKRAHNHHVDYVCFDNHDHTIHGITTVNELYRDVGTGERPTEHQVYTNGGSGDMRLVQLAIC